jgi:hypothetical protein
MEQRDDSIMFAFNSKSGDVKHLPFQRSAYVKKDRDDSILAGLGVVRPGAPAVDQNVFDGVVSEPKPAEHGQDMQAPGVKRLNVPSEHKGKGSLGTPIRPPIPPHSVSNFTPKREQSFLRGALNLATKSPFGGSRGEDEASLIPTANREVGDAGDTRTGRRDTGVLDLSIEAESNILILAQGLENTFLAEISREVLGEVLTGLEISSGKGALLKVLFLPNELIVGGSDEIGLLKLAIVGQGGPNFAVVDEGLSGHTRAIMFENHPPHTVGGISQQDTETTPLDRPV